MVETLSLLDIVELGNALSHGQQNSFSSSAERGAETVLLR